MRIILSIAAFACSVLSFFLNAQTANAQAVNTQTVQVMDSRGPQTLPYHPVRPVILDWSLTEQVIELGVEPIGAPELPGYRDWVVQPAMPASTKSVGTRTEPNLEQISALQPDIILMSNANPDLLSKLEKIAPVLVYNNFSAEENHAQVAIEQFKRLAVVFDKESVAQQKLEAMDNAFSDLKQQINDAFHQQVPPVVVTRFASTTATNIYSTNSIPHYVIEKLGLKDAFPVPAAEWGYVQKPISDLQHVKDGIVLYFLPFNDEAKLKKSILWRAMPFVRENRIHSVRSVWSYGGAMSLLYNAQAITESLLKVAHSHES